MPRDRHRVRGRFEIPASAESGRRRDNRARFHRSLGFARTDFLDSDSFFENEMEQDAEQVASADLERSRQRDASEVRRRDVIARSL
jgi:hypothetical protein